MAASFVSGGPYLSAQARRRLAVAGIVVAVVAVALIFGLRPLVDWAVSNIYKNVAEPLDKELPVTVTSFPSATNVVSAIGGKGEGLNCSMPWGIDFIFASKAGAPGTTVPVRQRFRQACVFHDLCYRHGLATYGYTQNDCDELLQEHALRICVSVSPQKTLGECQLDAKKVTAGVKIGGFKSYQGWGRSTFFEFDTNPYRSIQHSVVRAVDHPFKARFPDALRNEANQLLVKFKILRGGVRYVCMNCEQRKLSLDEWAFAEAPNPSGGLKERDMNEEGMIWIPSGRLFSAPHVAGDGDGRQVFVWLTRESFDNSNSCVVVVEPKKLLTHTRPVSGGCVRAASQRMELGQVDLLSSSPQLAMVRSASPSNPQMASAIVGTGMTSQRSNDLEICVSQNMRKGQNDDKRTCHKLKNAAGNTISGPQRFGAFQNFPVVRGERHIYFSRTMGSAQNNESDETIRLLSFDVTQQHMPGSNAAASGITLLADKKFEVKDDYDPIMPIALDGSDMRMIAAKVSTSWLRRKLGLSDDTLEFYEIDVGSPNPKLVKVPAETAQSREVALHESWARRPILVVEGGTSEADKKTQLILSRSETIKQEGEKPKDGTGSNLTDQARFEFAVLERPTAPAAQPARFRLVRGLTCTVTYTVTRPDDDRIKPCQRVAADVSTHRATPATMLQGAQLLVGRFSSADESQLALVDRCLPMKPIIIQPVGIGSNATAAPDPPPAGRTVQRDVKCQPVANPDSIAAPM